MTFLCRALLLFALPAAAAIAEKPDFAAAFPQLARKELKNEGVTLLYPRERAAAASPPAWLAEYEAAGVYASAPLTLRLGDLPPLTLICDSGPSADPSCRLLPDAAKPEHDVFAAPGTQFAFLADARIVVGGHSNTFYDERKLYEWKNGRFAEVPQPLRHVGIEGTMREAVALLRTPGGDALGISIPAGARVTVLLHDTSRTDADGKPANYLLLTPEGLVGWAALPGRPDGTTAVDGLYYRGD
jgi:hypothetical protein